jgi:carbon-monoxide dehydrogenase medium subunit
VHLDPAHGRITRVAIGLIGMGSVPVRAAAVERTLIGTEAAGLDLADVGAQAVADADPPADVHASARYRAKVGATLVARALSTAFKEANRG